jgi:hypothetical protein
MEKTGLAETPKVTTSAPTMYREIEQDEDVARGHVKIVEIIAYDFVRKEKNDIGKEKTIEKGREPYFCQDAEDILVFKEKNPNVRTETFTVQVLKSTAIKYLNNPRNMKQFKKEV